MNKVYYYWYYLFCTLKQNIGYLAQQVYQTKKESFRSEHCLKGYARTNTPKNVYPLLY